MEEIDDVRNELLKNSNKITVTDLGAGSKVFKSDKRKISDIVKYSAISKKYGELLFRLAVFQKPEMILEIGTSLGFGTMYLAKPNSKAEIYTLEGCPATSEIAGKNLRKLQIENVKQIVGNFDNKLNAVLNNIETLDFVYFDGNHKKSATLNYFNQCLPKIKNNTIFVFDDIHWSDDMEEAWNTIKSNPKVTLTVDLFFKGLVFFRKELSKQNFIVKF